MTMLVYTYAAFPKLPNGTNPVYLYISQEEPTNTDFPKEEREAAKDAEQLVRDIVGVNTSDDDPDSKLLQRGKIPVGAIPVFQFAIGIYWHKHNKRPHYFKVGFKRHLDGAKWNPVAEVGMEQMEYTMSVIRKRENALLRQRNLKKPIVPPETKAAAEAEFKRICDTIMAVQYARIEEREMEQKLFDCPNRKNDYCSPVKCDCPLYKNGRCTYAEKFSRSPTAS